MKRPICKTTCTSSIAAECDRCPQQRGIWLDRGELEKLVELTSSASAACHPLPVDRSDSARSNNCDDRWEEKGPRTPARQTRESWLSELFDCG